MTDAPASGFSVRVSDPGGTVCTVSLAGELDLTTTDELRSRFERFGTRLPSSVVMDLRELSFVDSSGLNALVAVARMVEANEGRIVFAGANDHIAGLFEIVRFAEAVTVESSVDAALEQAEREASARG
jgi:anti-sigma B factor antagonist